LRKGLKIKACFVFLAWLMIFMHNVIPHNHLEESFTGCHELFHHTSPDGNNSDLSLKLNGGPVDVNVCHISNLLFHSFSPDNLIIHSFKDINAGLVCMTDRILICTEPSFFSNHCQGTVFLRAPPAA
jgi:hypothetical protein